jgi:uncharacterized protein (DUF58 family)
MASEKVDLLDPAAVASGEALGLAARQIMEGYRVGDHRSPLHGFAIEFAQHREYATGDDVRHLDWKVLGRTDRYYIKQYEQDTNFICHLLIDGSESMNYGAGKLTKLQYSKILAACLSYIVLHQRDAVALNLFDTEIRDQFSRTDNPGKIHDIMRKLSEFKAVNETRIGKVMHDLAGQIRPRSIVVLISDLFDDEEAFQKNVERLRFQKCEVIVFHVLDPDEMEFPFTGTVKFIGLEKAGELQTSPAAIRKSYLKVFDEFRMRMRRICDRTGSHYILANTKIPIGETLSEYLAFRQNYRSR